MTDETTGSVAPKQTPEEENALLRAEILRLENTISHLVEKETARTAREANNKRRLEELEALVTTDELTGLLNRRGLTRDLGRYLSTVKRAVERGHHLPSPATFVYLDLDRFKPVNDLLGHDVGDVLIMKMGSVLTQTLRENDYIAHLSGDEFAVVLKNVGSKELAEHVIEKVRVAVQKITVDADNDKLEMFYRAIGRRHAVQISAGYYVINGAELDPRQIEKRAEQDVPKFLDARSRRAVYTPR